MAGKSVAALLDDIRLLGEERHDTVQAVRSLVRKTVEPVSEDVKYGGILFSSGVQFGGVFAYRNHVSVEFSHGAAIDDTLGHLEGGGRLRRHLKLTSAADVQDKQLSHYLLFAVRAAKHAA